MTKLSIVTRQLHKVANIMVESFECCQENSCQIVTPCYLFKRSSLVSGSSLFLDQSKNNSSFGLLLFSDLGFCMASCSYMY